MKTILLYFTVFIFTVTLNAQDLEWVTQHSSVTQSWTTSSTFDSNQNVISVGEFSGTIDLDPSANTANVISQSTGQRNVFLQKLDVNQNYIWGIRFGGNLGGPFPKKIITDGNDDIIMIGDFLSGVNFDPNGSFVLGSNGSYDGFIAKYSGVDGSLIWAMQIGGTGSDTIKDIAIPINNATNVNHNYFVICGGFRNTVNFNPLGSAINLTSNGDMDIFAMKYGTNGQLLWDYTAGSTGIDFASSIIANSTGVIFTGQFNETVDFDYSNNTYSSFAQVENYGFIVKLNSSSSFASMNPIHFTDTLFKDLKIGGSGGNRVFISGKFESDIILNDSGDVLGVFDNVPTQRFILATNVAASHQIPTYSGFKITGDMNQDVSINIKNIVYMNDANIYIIGDFDGTMNISTDVGTILEISNGGKDIFIIKMNSYLTINSLHKIGGTGDDYVYDAQGRIPDPNNAFHLVAISGSFQNTVDFDLSTGVNELTASGTNDGFTMLINNDAPTASIISVENLST